MLTGMFKNVVLCVIINLSPGELLFRSARSYPLHFNPTIFRTYPEPINVYNGHVVMNLVEALSVQMSNDQVLVDSHCLSNN